MSGWQHLQKGIAIGCSISPILFTTAFGIILIGGRQMVKGVRGPSGQRLPAVRGYIDDINTLLQAAACTNRLLKRLEELITWARMEFKPAKSQSLLIRIKKEGVISPFRSKGKRSPCWQNNQCEPSGGNTPRQTHGLPSVGTAC